MEDPITITQHLEYTADTTQLDEVTEKLKAIHDLVGSLRTMGVNVNININVQS